MTPPCARLAALVLVLALLVPGCGKYGRPEMVGGGVFNAFLMEPASLDPAHLQSPMELQVARQIFKGLTDYDPENMETIPAMADSWTASADAVIWTFYLKKGVSFQNGRECTASDFVYSWNRAADPRTAGPAAYHLAPIKGYKELRDGAANELAGLRAIDDYTLEVTLEYPYAEFPTRVAHPAFAPIPREGVTDDFGEHPVGTGPFRFVRWEHQVELVIEKFPEYFGENQPDLDQVVFKIYPDIESGWRDFKAGELDDARIPPGQYDVASVEFGDRALFEPLLSTLFYGFDMEAEPWRGNENFRRGLNWSVDRELLSISIMQGTASAATGMVAQGTFGYQSSAMPYRYDPEKAGSLLARDFPEGRDIPTDLILAYDGNDREELVAQSVQSDFRQVGVELAIAGYPPDIYAEMLRSRGIDFFCQEWQVDYPAMDAFLYPLFYSGNAGSTNQAYYRNPEVDALLDRARRTVDAGKRIDLYRQAEKIVLEEAPVIPLVFAKTSRVISDRVGGYLRTPLDYTPFELVYEVKPS
jgi:oligopeptide transport system substrate-binding protein